MNKTTTIICLLLLSITGSCNGQTTVKKMNNNNPLLCDPEKGFCEIPDSNDNTLANKTHDTSTKALRIIYFTDPICSSCWGIEPQLRKLKLEYGATIEMEYHMGGLLPDWSYNSGGISKPSDVAHHWDEVSQYYQMPIDGDVWLEDPLHSSYPPSIAFKAAQMQDKVKAIKFLRAMRELVFLKKKNITKWEHLAVAAKEANLNIEQLKKDYEGQAEQLFKADLDLARKMGVRGFPSVFIVNEKGEQEFIYGFKPYTVYETAIKKLAPTATKQSYQTDWKILFNYYSSLTAKEFAELKGINLADAEKELNDLFNQKLLNKLTTKNGSLWTKMN